MAEGSLVLAQSKALEFTKKHVLSDSRWSGVGDLPRKVDGGYPYTGANVPMLLSQLPETRSPAIFGTLGQWALRKQQVKIGEKGLGFIYMKSFKKTQTDLNPDDALLDIADNGRVLVPFANFVAFAQCQLDGYELYFSPPVLEALKRQEMDDGELKASGEHALKEAERYMLDWMHSPEAKRRSMGEEECCLIEHLASDLVVGYNAGSMQVAGEVNQPYPEIAQTGLQKMVCKEIMRPWGIACDILRHLSPLFAANIKAGAEAARASQEAYKKRSGNV